MYGVTTVYEGAVCSPKREGQEALIGEFTASNEPDILQYLTSR